MEFFEQVKQTFRRMDERLTKVEGQLTALRDAVTEQVGLMQVQVSGLREDVQGVGGAFASIETMLIANAAQMADFKQRLEVLERKAS